jgi:hypothetical protein
MGIILDTGTADPDDVLAICYLADKGVLDAVSLYPGSNRQVGLVNTILRELKLSIPVAGNASKADKDFVSPFYSKVFKFVPENPDAQAGEMIKDFLAKGSKILTCEAPFNLKGLHIPEWNAQGGYCPHSLMEESQRLEKFKDMETCQSFNFGSPTLIDSLIADSDKRTFVSKNVCHGVKYDKNTHATMKDGMIKKIMTIYLRDHDEKAFHDLLAASIIFDRDICQFKEVEMYHDKNRWGCFEKEGSNTFISVGVDKDKFWRNIGCNIQ